MTAIENLPAPVPSTVFALRREQAYFKDTTGKSGRLTSALMHAMAYQGNAESRYFREHNKLLLQRLREQQNRVP